MVVAEELVGRSVKLICARSTGHVHRGAGASELSAIRVGEDLEFRDSVHSESVARDARTCPMIKEVSDIGVIEQERHAYRAGSGNRLVVLIAVGWIGRCSGSGLSQ